VRWHVASRAGVDLLRKLVDDEDSEVRERARERLETLEGAHHG